ncbi:uncharacterized protein ACO6RY_03470 [Pungitius sinensis]
MPLERFLTSYSRDYKPFGECHLQVNQPRPRCEAAAAPACINTTQSRCETWPAFQQYFYKTSNSIYGSTSCPQPPTSSRFFPGSLRPLGVYPSVSAFVGSPPTGAGTREIGVEREVRPLPGEGKKGQLHYVCGGDANMSEQQEAQDVLWRKSNVLYEEGVMLLSSHIGPACCKDFLRSVCREAGLQRLLDLPVASIPITTTKNAGNWVTEAHLRGMQTANGMRDRTFLQHTSRQYSCCACETENPRCCCFEMNTSPPCVCRSSIPPLGHAQPTFRSTEPSGMLPLTEYQARYFAGWAQLQMQRRDIHHHQVPRHQIRYPHL